MDTNFAPYSLRHFRPKSAAIADNGFTATLVRAGTAVAKIDCGHDPEDDDMIVEFINRSEQEHFVALASARTSPIEDMSADERFLRDLAEATYHAARLADLTRKTTVFRLGTDPPGLWRQVRAPFRAALARAVHRRFPASEVQFANPAV